VAGPIFMPDGRHTKTSVVIRLGPGTMAETLNKVRRRHSRPSPNPPAPTAATRTSAIQYCNQLICFNCMVSHHILGQLLLVLLPHGNHHGTLAALLAVHGQLNGPIPDSRHSVKQLVSDCDAS
jgi:hypothetical protein